MDGPVRKVKLSRHSLHHEVAASVRQMIIHGDLKAGEKIPVAGICAMLGVSQTPLREALKILAEERLVTIEVNRGARVSVYSVEEAVNLFEVIAVIEGLAAELTCARMTGSVLATLEDLHGRMTSAFHAVNKDTYFDLNSAIHHEIIEACGNEELQLVHQRLMLRAERGRYMAIMDEGRWSQAFEEHETLMKALRSGDVAGAGAIWRVHLVNTGRALERAFRTFRLGEN